MAKDHQIFTLSANPHEAQMLFEQFCDAYQKQHPHPLECPKDSTFLKIFGNSKFLSLFAIKNTQVFDHYQSSPYKDTEKPYKVFLSELREAVSKSPDPLNAIKFYKYQEYLRLTLKELLLYDQRVTYREFSHLATATTTLVAELATTEYTLKHQIDKKPYQSFAIIGMGKLGGLELNYSSDIDLIGLYDAEDNSLKISKHEFFENVFARMGQVMSQVDSQGFMFRVDWDLRPEGRSGTLANSLSAMETYYQTFGEEWERQAYLKAQVVYQSSDVGDEFLKLMKPFVYRKSFDEKTIKSVWNMKQKIVSEWRYKQKGQDGINIKLDEGGIRDIEFFVQGFQLVYGGRFAEIQTTNTLTALEALLQKDLINTNTKNTLESSYLFLRRLESCLQMESERQTHVVKTNKGNLIKLARRMGYTQSDDDAASELRERLFNTRSVIKSHFAEVYGNV